MNRDVEERLRQALAERAETTTTSSDAWVRIRDGIDRRRAFPRWTVLAPAALAVAALVVLVSVVGPERGGTVRVTGDTGRLYLEPTGVEPRFRLTDAGNGPNLTARSPWSFRVFGRRAPDGVALQASVVITVPADRAVGGTTPEDAPLRVLGRDVAVSRDGFGQRILTWTQADGATVGVMTLGLSDAELVALAASLLAGDAAKATPVLPAGFDAIGNGVAGGGVPSITTQAWHADDGDRFSVTVSESADAGEPAWWLPGGRGVEVRGKTAVFLVREEAFLVWMERPGTIVVLQATGLSENELVAIAEGLRTVDDQAWRALVARAARPAPPAGVQSPQIGPPPGVVPPDDNYLLLLPVKAQSAPPCAAVPPAIVLAERRGGQEVMCYQVTRPFLDAGDVATAQARDVPPTGHWEVQLTLTPEGTAHLRELFAEVGAGGQFVILVDGQIVGAPRFGGAPPGNVGVVSNLDEPTARGLADRLRR